MNRVRTKGDCETHANAEKVTACVVLWRGTVYADTDVDKGARGAVEAGSTVVKEYVVRTR